MIRRYLSVVAALCLMVPSIAGAEFAPQFKESSQGKTDLSKSAPVHGKVYKSKTAMEQTAHQKKVTRNKQVMERNASQMKQMHKRVQGTVNE